MSQTAITDRYAKALFDLAQEKNALYPVYVSLQDIAKILKAKSELFGFIHNPLLKSEEKAKVLSGIFENKVPPVLHKFLQFLNAKGRLNTLAEVFESFDALYLAKNNEMRAFLQTPFALAEEQKKSIEEKLAGKYKKEISLDVQVKPELLGGFRLLAEGMLYDGSIKTQLEQFRQKVSA